MKRFNDDSPGHSWHRRPTITEVARKAGVSVGTASHVINGRPGVSSATRQKVEQAIAELGFRPNVLAQSLNAQRFRESPRSGNENWPWLTAIGYVNVDYTARVPVLPHRDDRMTAIGIEKSLGGPATNVAVMAAAMADRLPVRCELITVVGDDADSDWALGELAARGVEIVGVRRQPGQRLSRCIILVEPNGSRTIINEPLALGESDLSSYLSPREVDRHCVHLEGFQVPLLIETLPELRARGIITSVHVTGLPPDWRTRARFDDLCARFDLVFLNRETAREILSFRGPEAGFLDRMANLRQEISGPGSPELMVLTLGAAGALVLPAGRDPVHVPAPEVEPVDTTGAGDAFVGIFLAAWLNGVPPDKAARYATAGASLAVTAMGAQGRIPNALEIEGCLARAGG